MRNVIPILLAITAFGPYLTSSVRLEHLVIYPFGFLALLIIVTRHLTTLDRLPSQVIYLLSGIIAVAFFNTFLAYRVPLTKVFSQMDNWTQPIAIALIALLYGAQFYRAFGWILGLLGVNAALQLYQTLTGDADINARFVSVADTGTSVAELSAGNGRYLGVFGQPLEGGVAFGVGLLLWLYLNRQGKNGFWMWVSLPLILIGGLLTVSKIFLLIAVPLFIGYVLWEKFQINWLTTWRGLGKTALIVGSLLIGLQLLTSSWRGADYALRLLNPSERQGQSLVEFYTSGRLGGETPLNDVVQQTIREEPIFGYGFQSFVTVDNGYFDAYSQSGVMGVLLFSALGIVIFLRGWKLRRTPQGRLLMLMALFGVLANIGAPALTINRASILFWVVAFGASALPAPARHREADHAKVREFAWD